MITRIHRNNAFRVMYNESGRVEKYAQSDRIALLPAIQYDAKITKYVTSYHTDSNGNDSGDEATSIQNELNGLSMYTYLLD